MTSHIKKLIPRLPPVKLKEIELPLSHSSHALTVKLLGPNDPWPLAPFALGRMATSSFGQLGHSYPPFGCRATGHETGYATSGGLSRDIVISLAVAYHVYIS